MLLLLSLLFSALAVSPPCHSWRDCPAAPNASSAALESDVLAYLTLEVTQTAAWTFFLQVDLF